MVVIATVNEINAVMKHFNPAYPPQSLDSIKANDSFYIFNGVPVEVIVRKESDDAEKTAKSVS